MPPRALVTALAALVAALAASASAGAASRGCGLPGYSYAGYESAIPAYGASGRLTALAAPAVEGGHVAAWIGVGGFGVGPRGTDEWLQVGLAGFPDGRAELYYEYLLPTQQQPVYVRIEAVLPREGHDVAIYERPSQPNVWRVAVDGTPVSPPIALPGSHGAWRPIATTESWDGGSPACNGFSYDFGRLAVASRHGGGWQPFVLTEPVRDAGYRLDRRASGFRAWSPGEAALRRESGIARRPH
jgi:hypothetical protein